MPSPARNVDEPPRGPGRRPAPRPGPRVVAAALGEIIHGNVVAAGVVRDGRIEYANDAFAALFGYGVADLQGRTALVDLAIEADKPAVSESLRRCLAARGGTSRLEFTGLRSDGGVVVVEMRARGTELRGERAAVLAMLDMTEKSHAFNRLRNLAFYDPLTDLPNRALFFDRDMDHLMALADAAMYESKARGKNTFTFAPEGELAPPVRVLIEWSDTLRLDVEVIDDQHRRLVELANRLGDDLREGRDATTQAASMRELVEHTKLHFRTEEGLMDAYDLPGVDRHRQEHRRLLADLHSLGASLEATSLTLTLQHLKAWLVRHVESLDRELAADLRARGHA